MANYWSDVQKPFASELEHYDMTSSSYAPRAEPDPDREQSQRIDAVGQVAQRIAHDFSNMLAAIMGGLTLIERRLQRGDTDPVLLTKYMAASMDGANRALALTHRLLRFSREKPLQLRPTDVDQLLVRARRTS